MQVHKVYKTRNSSLFPGIQAILTVTVPNRLESGIPGLVWDKYTSAGWVAAILGFINLVIVMPGIFQVSIRCFALHASIVSNLTAFKS